MLTIVVKMINRTFLHRPTKIKILNISQNKKNLRNHFKKKKMLITKTKLNHPNKEKRERHNLKRNCNPKRNLKITVKIKANKTRTKSKQIIELGLIKLLFKQFF